MPSRSSRTLVVLVGALVLSGWACRHREAAPLEKSARTPRLADFAGWQKCAECHVEIAESWRKTGHARTFLDTWDSEIAHQLNGRTFFDPERKSLFRYVYDPGEGLIVSIPGKFGGKPFPLDYLLGSNQHARTFLTLIPQLNGETAGVEHRVSLFGEDFDLTPSHQGIQAAEAVEAFGAIEDPQTADRCIGCHTTFHQIRPHRLEQVLPNVQCEACHGPGAEHSRVAATGSGMTKLPTLKAGTAESALRQIELCGRCHRLPSDLPADSIKTDYRQLARFQPIGLMESACFKKSGGRLACSDCHNPHQPIAEQSAHAITSCLGCHAGTQKDHVACPVSPLTDCIRCHMPEVAVHPRVSFHDHWIRIHPKADAADGQQEPATGHSGNLRPPVTPALTPP